MYQAFARIIESANIIMDTYMDDALGDVCVYPEKGTVAFSAGLHGWVFTLNHFASIYARKFGVDHNKMGSRLWGDDFFNKFDKKWVKKAAPVASRAFCEFVLKPIQKVIELCMMDKTDDLRVPLGRLDITLTSADKQLRQKATL
jgi:elongation factor 2